jgi:hypothetical protein
VGWLQNGAPAELQQLEDAAQQLRDAVAAQLAASPLGGATEEQLGGPVGQLMTWLRAAPMGALMDEALLQPPALARSADLLLPLLLERLEAAEPAA